MPSLLTTIHQLLMEKGANGGWRWMTLSFTYLCSLNPSWLYLVFTLPFPPFLFSFSSDPVIIHFLSLPPLSFLLLHNLVSLFLSLCLFMFDAWSIIQKAWTTIGISSTSPPHSDRWQVTELCHNDWLMTGPFRECQSSEFVWLAPRQFQRNLFTAHQSTATANTWEWK